MNKTLFLLIVVKSLSDKRRYGMSQVKMCKNVKKNHWSKYGYNTENWLTPNSKL